MSVFLSGDQQEASRELKARTRLLLSGFLFIFLVIGARALQLTLFPDAEHKPKVASANDELVPRRADIVDRNGKLLATSLKVSSLYADALLLEDYKATLDELKKIFPDLNETRLGARLAKKGRFVWIRRHITPVEAAKVNALGIPGLEFMEEYQRVYPFGGMTSHIVGAVSVDGQGIEGAEKVLDPELKNPDKRVRLAMDSRVQNILAEEIQATVDHFQALGGAGIVIDIPTGEVLAAISLPTFDPNHPGNPNDRARFNRLVSGVYEMGSCFKIFSTAAMIETKDPPMSQTYDATNPLKRGRFMIKDFHPEKKVMTIPEIFMHSSNIGTALMAEDLGTAGLKGFYEKLGFFEPLKTDLLTTAKPLVPNPWRPISTDTTSYGHGISVTPLHVAEATLKVLSPDRPAGLEFILDDGARQTGRGDAVVSEKTADAMRRLLRLVVRSGTGEKADVKGYLVGGKTATAEKVSGRGYNKSALLSSFVGVYPADNPKTLVIVMIDEPKGQKDTYGYATAGWTAAPAVGNVISRLTALRGELPRAVAALYDPSDPLLKYLPEEVRQIVIERSEQDKKDGEMIGNDR